MTGALNIWTYLTAAVDTCKRAQKIKPKMISTGTRRDSQCLTSSWRATGKWWLLRERGESLRSMSQWMAPYPCTHWQHWVDSVSFKREHEVGRGTGWKDMGGLGGENWGVDLKTFYTCTRNSRQFLKRRKCRNYKRKKNMSQLLESHFYAAKSINYTKHKPRVLSCVPSNAWGNHSLLSRFRGH